MDFAAASHDNGCTVLFGTRNFCLDDILDCGQAFRWTRLADGHWRGIVRGLCREIVQHGDVLRFEGVTEEEFNRVWLPYFDLDRDYGAVKEILCRNEAMRNAVLFAPGMRVLRQEPWEALCSFILSQNNNIARIRGLVERLCENFGEPVNGGFAFPSPERLAALPPDGLAPVRCGFRSRYILDAAAKVASGEINLEKLADMPAAQVEGALRSIVGVGPKVAACALLYGFSRTECVPVDVWIGRANREFFPEGLGVFGEYAGLGQQYLFHYMRFAGAVR